MNNQCGKSCSVELLSNTVMRVLTLPSNDWSEAPNPHAAGYCSWIGSASKTWTSSRWDVDGRPLQSCLRWHIIVKSLTPEGLLFPPRVMRAGFSLTKISNVVMAFLCFRACQTLLVSQDKRCSSHLRMVFNVLGMLFPRGSGISLGIFSQRKHHDSRSRCLLHLWLHD